MEYMLQAVRHGTVKQRTTCYFLGQDYTRHVVFGIIEQCISYAVQLTSFLTSITRFNYSLARQIMKKDR